MLPQSSHIARKRGVLDAAILSRTRSPITSRSNWANDSNTLSVRRPMLDVGFFSRQQYK